jgi:FAD/FMN-containing dehydrogenase
VFDVYSRLAASGTTVPAGSCPLVGIGGQALGGGIGFASRALGLSADNLMGAEIVTADGRITVVDEASDPELLWALRGGGGGNFGVVTALRFRTHATPPSAAWFTLGWRWSSAAEALATWFDWASTAPDAITSILRVTAEAGAPRVEAFGQYLGPSSRLAVLLRPLTAISGARLAGGDQAYLDLQRRWAGCLQLPQPCRDALAPEGVPVGARFWAKSDFIRSGFGATAARTVVEAIQRRASMTGIGAIEFHALGGAINRVPPRATAFVHRDASCCVQYLTYNTGDDWLRETHAVMRPFVSGTAYQNYIDPELDDWRAAYYGENYRRLVDVRRRVDPHRFFRFPQAIGE